MTSWCRVITKHVGLMPSVIEVLNSSSDQAELHESLLASWSATVLSCSKLCNGCMLNVPTCSMHVVPILHTPVMYLQQS